MRVFLALFCGAAAILRKGIQEDERKLVAEIVQYDQDANIALFHGAGLAAVTELADLENVIQDCMDINALEKHLRFVKNLPWTNRKQIKKVERAIGKAKRRLARDEFNREEDIAVDNIIWSDDAKKLRKDRKKIVKGELKMEDDLERKMQKYGQHIQRGVAHKIDHDRKHEQHMDQKVIRELQKGEEKRQRQIQKELEKLKRQEDKDAEKIEKDRLKNLQKRKRDELEEYEEVRRHEVERQGFQDEASKKAAITQDKKKAQQERKQQKAEQKKQRDAQKKKFDDIEQAEKAQEHQERQALHDAQEADRERIRNQQKEERDVLDEIDDAEIHNLEEEQAAKRDELREMEKVRREVITGDRAIQEIIDDLIIAEDPTEDLLQRRAHHTAENEGKHKARRQEARRLAKPFP